VFYLVQEACARKTPAQESMTHAQKTRTSQLNLLEHVSSILGWLRVVQVLLVICQVGFVIWRHW